METQRFDDWATYRTTLAALISEPTVRLDWLDDDLSQTGIGTLMLVEPLNRFLMSRRTGGLRLLLCNASWFHVHCPRAIQLFETWGHRVEIRVCTEEDQPVEERFLLGDNTVIRRFHADAARGEYTAEGQIRALCRQRFEALWHGAAPVSISRPLGL